MCANYQMKFTVDTIQKIIQCTGTMSHATVSICIISVFKTCTRVLTFSCIDIPMEYCTRSKKPSCPIRSIDFENSMDFVALIDWTTNKQVGDDVIFAAFSKLHFSDADRVSDQCIQCPALFCFGGNNENQFCHDSFIVIDKT